MNTTTNTTKSRLGWVLAAVTSLVLLGCASAGHQHASGMACQGCAMMQTSTTNSAMCKMAGHDHGTAQTGTNVTTNATAHAEHQH